MKRFGKIMLVLICVFLAAGLGLSAAGIAMGAGMKDVEIPANIGNGVRHLSDIVILNGNWPGSDEDESKTSESGTKAYQMNPVREIELDVDAGEVLFQETDDSKMKVEITGSSSDQVKVESSSDKLSIKTQGTRVGVRNGITINVFYPKNTAFEKMELCVSAGSLSLEGSFSTKELKVETGAGEVRTNAEITTEKLDVEVGTGEAEITGLTVREIDAECGIGSLKLGVRGEESDYNYSLECGIGSVSVNGRSYSGLGKEEDIRNAGAEGTISLECGIGEIELVFEK